ncbi:hypothetical protein [Paraburkholderia ginsengiterrae]|uniref:hypothetical protein n=1 Tax=Paraburkholderia ginsengiterrae TaxID=1462993 RepID=UPI000A4CE26C|nr:hypothetical protein [Paraburkholderia ginsengiterrae]
MKNHVADGKPMRGVIVAREIGQKLALRDAGCPVTNFCSSSISPPPLARCPRQLHVMKVFSCPRKINRCTDKVPIWNIGVRAITGAGRKFRWQRSKVTTSVWHVSR